jgi:glucose dehydrogenase
MPNPVPTASYRARDGTRHRVLVRRTPEGRWQVLDRRDGQTIAVETLTGHDARRAQAEALARDYAAEQQAHHDGRRPDPPLRGAFAETSRERPWAA